MIIHNSAQATVTKPQRVVFELYSHLYPQLANHIRSLFTGEQMFGFKNSNVSKLFPNNAITFHLVGEPANYSAGIFTPVPGGQKPQPNQYAIVVSQSKLKLGNYFELVAKFGPLPPTTTTAMSDNPTTTSNDDDIVIGQIIDGHCIFTPLKFIQTNTTTHEPLERIQIIECGEL